MKFWNKFCGIVLFFSALGVPVEAQNSTGIKLTNKTFPFKNVLITSDTASHHPSAASIITGFGVNEALISENFSTACYGFFCRQELKIEKATRIPFRFRLGSLQQCNYYEGKR